MCTNQMFRCVLPNGRSQIVHGINWVKKASYMHNYESVQPIPCGNCLECKLKHAEEWVFRCSKEVETHKHNLMVTLTYDDAHLPLSKKVNLDTGEVATTLDHEHVKLFMKRVRKKYGDNIQMLMCGEYGSANEYVDWKGKVRIGTERPHYHLILIGIEVDDLRFFKYSKCDWSSDKNALYRSPTLTKLWGRGDVECNEVNSKTINYVARYTTKKLRGNEAKEKYDVLGRKPPYLVASKRPALGLTYFENNIDKFWNDEPKYIKTDNGLKDIGVVRYYDKKLQEIDPVRFEDLKFNREKRAENFMEQLLSMTDIDEQTYVENKHRRKEAYRKKLSRGLI